MKERALPKIWNFSRFSCCALPARISAVNKHQGNGDYFKVVLYGRPLLKVVSYRKRIEMVVNPLGPFTNPQKETAVISYTLVLLRAAPGWVIGPMMLDRKCFVRGILPVLLTVCLETARSRQLFHHSAHGPGGVSKPVSSF